MDKGLEAAVMDCLAEIRPQLGEDFWMEFIDTPVNDLTNYHFGLGLYLRNNVLTPESELYKLFALAGIGHKDDMSSLMIKRWHEALDDRQETGSSGREQKHNYLRRMTKMQETGIIRKIDELGRIVLPIEVRKLFELKEKNAVEIFTDEGGIYLKPYDTEHCAFCAGKDNLLPHSGRYICGTCLTQINEQAAGK